MIGDEVTKYRSLLELSYPTSEGIVQNWDDMSLLLDYAFKSVKIFIHLGSIGRY
jgi:actin-related protein 2